MRAFVAIALPDDVRSAIAAVIAPVVAAHPGPRWVRPENLHLTIEFLGSVDETLVRDLDARLPLVAAATDSADLVLSGVGAFPPRRPRVLWLALGEGEAWFVRLTEAVRVVVRELGLEPDRRPPSAHVTLARQERPERAALAALETAFADRSFAWRADRLTLHSSVLGRGGPTYTAEREWRFRA
jgi:2'-5' RNA ligase